MDVKAPAKKKVRARKAWVINPGTRIKNSGRLYKRPKVKEDIKGLYEPEEDET